MLKLALRYLLVLDRFAVPLTAYLLKEESALELTLALASQQLQ